MGRPLQSQAPSVLFEITASNTLLETRAPGYRAVPGEERGEFGFVAVFAARLGLDAARVELVSIAAGAVVLQVMRWHL